MARRLAQLDGSSITDAVVVALKEAIRVRTSKERPSETARRLLARRGLAFVADRRPVPEDAYRDLDHDLAAGG